MDDFEDAVIHSVAEDNKADYILTRNIKDFFKSTVKIISPDDCVNRFCS